MPRLVFVYAGSPDEQRRQSPYSITRNLYSFFKNKGLDVVYKNWTDSGVGFQVDKNDIVLGHPAYDQSSIIQHIFRSGQKCKAKILIHPLHLNFVEDNLPFDDLWKSCDAGIAITGKYWYDVLEKSKFAHWKPKMTRIDMAVDHEIYKWYKKDIGFRVEGTRELVYIGSSTHNKNLWYLTNIMRAMPTVKLNWFGGSSDHSLAKLPNVTTTGWQELNDGVLKQICGSSDIFVNVSISDANPTSLIEAASLGLVIACTKESGYYNDQMVTTLPLDDVSEAVKIITELLLLPIPEMEKRSAYNRQEIEKKYNWNVFCNTVWSVVNKFM